MRTLLKILLIALTLQLVGCAVTSHPDYEKTYFKANVSDESMNLALRQLKSVGLNNVELGKDSLNRVVLLGDFQNEDEVDKAFSILANTVGLGNYSTVRPQKIKLLRWEIEATQQFAKFIRDLGAKFKVAVALESDGPDKQINVTNLGFDGFEQFPFGSDQPSTRAKEFYKELATNLKVTGRHLASQKKILIVGHTDDIGDTNYNMALSERRAKAVGRIFSDVGFPNSNLFFQGAGEVLPIASNETPEGRTKNRRVEIAELSDEDTLNRYSVNRRPQVSLYRFDAGKPVNQNTARVPSTPTPSAVAQQKPLNNTVVPQISAPIQIASRETETLPKFFTHIDFGGKPFSPDAALLRLPKLEAKKSSFSFISHAQAQDVNTLVDCTRDRPRSIGQVKVLDSGLPKNYRPTDYMRGLAGKPWAGMVNNNLLVMDNVWVIRENGESPTPVKLKAFEKYSNNPNQKPAIDSTSPVNSYLIGDGVLFRVFPNESTGLKCMDVLLPVDGQGKANQGLLVYSSRTGTFVADFKPQVYN